MAESAKAMIERFRNQKPLSREEREEDNARKGVKEMWWITEEKNRRGGGEEETDAETIELPRPSPIKPHLYPPTNVGANPTSESVVQNLNSSLHLRSSTGRDKGNNAMTTSLGNSDDEFLARLGLGKSRERSRDRSRDRDRDITRERDIRMDRSTGGSGVFSSHDFTRHSVRPQPSIDDFISDDVQHFSNSIERLLNAYPKHPSHSQEREMGVGVSGEGGYRLRASVGDRDRFYRNPFASSLDLRDSDVGGSGTLKGLLLSEKLDGRGDKDRSDADKQSGGERGLVDQRGMGEILEAVVDSLACLDQSSAEGGKSGPGIKADNIQQVYATLTADMSSFTALFGEKHGEEDLVVQERKERDEKMREEGRREGMRELQLDHLRVATLDPPSSVAVEGGGDAKSSALPPLLSAVNEASRLRAALVDKTGRPVWSQQQGRYVLPPSPQEVEEVERMREKQQEERDMHVSVPTFQPLFSPTSSSLSSHSPDQLPPTATAPGFDLSHGRITSAARAAIVTCLAATEKSLHIRLPEKEGCGGKAETVSVSVIEEVFEGKVSVPSSFHNPEVKEEAGHVDRGHEDGVEEQKVEMEENPAVTVTDTSATTTSTPPITTAAISAAASAIFAATASVASATPTAPRTRDKKELNERLDALLGPDDSETLLFAQHFRQHSSNRGDNQNYPTQSSSMRSQAEPRLGVGPFNAKVKWNNAEQIEAAQSKPTLPDLPPYEHSFFDRQRSGQTQKADLRVAVAQNQHQASRDEKDAHSRRIHSEAPGTNLNPSFSRRYNISHIHSPGHGQSTLHSQHSTLPPPPSSAPPLHSTHNTFLQMKQEHRLQQQQQREHDYHLKRPPHNHEKQQQQSTPQHQFQSHAPSIHTNGSEQASRGNRSRSFPSRPQDHTGFSSASVRSGDGDGDSGGNDVFSASADSNYYERSAFLEKMKRLRLNMAHH